MRKMKLATRLQVLIGIFALCATFGTTTSIRAQYAQCGQTLGTLLCPPTCGGTTIYTNAAFNGQGPSYLMTVQVYCGKICSYMQGNIVVTSCLADDLSIASMTPEVNGALRELAGGRDILVDGCGGKFKKMQDVSVTLASIHESGSANSSPSIAYNPPGVELP